MNVLKLLGFPTLLLATACAMPQQYRPSPVSLSPAEQNMLVDCQAIAAQSAQGAGSFFTDRGMRASWYDYAREQYLQQCLQARRAAQP